MIRTSNMDRIAGVAAEDDLAVESTFRPGAEPTSVPAVSQASAITIASACSTASKVTCSTVFASSSNATATFVIGASDEEKWFANLSANERTVADVMAGIEGSEKST